MAEIIDFPSEQPDADPSDGVETGDTFLLKEGLELLANYRVIKDADVRASIMRLVASISRAETRSAG